MVKLKAKSRVTNKALGLRLASQILKDMGIPNKRVSVFKKADAIEQITAHLKKGKPVIVKAHNRYVYGHKVAYGHHALVIFGIDKKGMGIFYDTSTGKLNFAHASATTFQLSIKDFVNRYMDSSTGNYNSLYVYDYNSAGGYILVG